MGVRLFALLAVLLVPTAAADHAIGHVEVPGGEIVDLAAELAAETTDTLVGASPVPLPPLPRPDLECEHHVNASGPYFFGIPVIQEIHEAHAQCRVGETVVVTPDPF